MDTTAMVILVLVASSFLIGFVVGYCCGWDDGRKERDEIRN